MPNAAYFSGCRSKAQSTKRETTKVSNIHSNTQQTRERQWSLEKEKRIMDKLPHHQHHRCVSSLSTTTPLTSPLQSSRRGIASPLARASSGQRRKRRQRRKGSPTHRRRRYHRRKPTERAPLRRSPRWWRRRRYGRRLQSAAQVQLDGNRSRVVSQVLLEG